MDPAQTPNDKPAETPAGGEKPAEKPVEKPAEKPVEQKTEEKKSETGKSLIGGDDEKTAEGKETKAEELKVTLPDGVKVDEKFLGNFKDIAKELGLKSDGAQKLVDLHLDFVTRLSKEFETQATKRDQEWAASLEKDPDFGGEKFKENATAVHRAVQKFGGEDFKKSVDEAGLGNWPPLVKLLAKIGASLKDDTSKAGEPAKATPANDADAFARALYGEKTPQLFNERK